MFYINVVACSVDGDIGAILELCVFVGWFVVGRTLIRASWFHYFCQEH